jgi:hypothetical protein
MRLKEQNTYWLQISKPYVSENLTRILSLKRAQRLILIFINTSYLFDFWVKTCAQYSAAMQNMGVVR